MTQRKNFYKTIFGKHQRTSIVRKPTKPPQTTPTKDFTLEDKTDYFSITGVSYRNEKYTVDLSKELLPSTTQEQHAINAVQAKKEGKFHTADFPLYFAINHTLYQNRDNTTYKATIEQARQFLKKQMNENWLTTLTRMEYNPKNQKDKVIHNYKQTNQHEISLDTFTGPDGHITDPETTNAIIPLQSFLDTNLSIEEINSIYKWIAGVDTRLWRVNNHPKKQDIRIVGFDAVSDGVGLDCDGDPRYSDSSFGVRARKI